MDTNLAAPFCMSALGLQTTVLCVLEDERFPRDVAQNPKTLGCSGILT